MKVNASLIIKRRKDRSWSQEELAIASGLNLRTIQRIESDASASLQSKKALAAALDIDTRDLDNEGVHMKPCPVCGSNEIYQYKDYFPNPGGAGERRCSRGWTASSLEPRSARPCATVVATFEYSPLKKPGRS